MACDLDWQTVTCDQRPCEHVESRLSVPGEELQVLFGPVLQKDSDGQIILMRERHSSSASLY